MPKKNYYCVLKTVSYRETADLSTKTAADEVRNLVISEKNDTVNENDSATNENDDADDSHSDENSIIDDDEFTADTVVLSDGSWQKRGYDSLNDIVTIIQMMLVNALIFVYFFCEKFIFEHNCPINHSGSGRSMEASGVVECFESSIQIESCDISN